MPAINAFLFYYISETIVVVLTAKNRAVNFDYSIYRGNVEICFLCLFLDKIWENAILSVKHRQPDKRVEMLVQI